VALCPIHVPAIDVEHLLLPQQSDSMVMTPRHGIPAAEAFEDEQTELTAVTEPHLRDRLQDFERQRIQEALDKCAGHQGNAAKLLGISRRTLFNKLEQYQIQRPRKSPRT
jgi:DNA-binding NtrC family response regulator